MAHLRVAQKHIPVASSLLRVHCCCCSLKKKCLRWGKWPAVAYITKGPAIAKTCRRKAPRFLFLGFRFRILLLSASCGCPIVLWPSSSSDGAIHHVGRTHVLCMRDAGFGVCVHRRHSPRWRPGNGSLFFVGEMRARRGRSALDDKRKISIRRRRRKRMRRRRKSILHILMLRIFHYIIHTRKDQAQCLHRPSCCYL